MPKVKVWIDRDAFSEVVLKGDGLKALVRSAADAVVDNAGDEFEATVNVGSRRVNARVHPATAHAYYSNRKHNTLLKAMGSVKV